MVQDSGRRFEKYLNREIELAKQKFGDDIAKKWHEQILTQKARVVARLDAENNRKPYYGYYHYKEQKK